MPFKDILGHEREIRVLREALNTGRLAHSYLFAGPEGIGKRKTAFELARALNCASATDDACGECASCLRAASGTHTNIVEVAPTVKDRDELVPDPSGLIRIEQIRDILSLLKYKADGGRKAVIVDGAERLMPQAANAFLKTLEEPPAGSIIMLVTSRPADLLPTIISRCQRVSFRPLPEEALIVALVEKTGATEEEAMTAARMTGRSLSLALKYIGEGRGDKGRELIKRLQSITDVSEALKFAEELSKKDDILEALETLKGWYRDRAIAASGAENLLVNRDVYGYSDGSFEGRRREGLAEDFFSIEETRRMIAPPRYANKLLAMEALILKLVD
ncbi:MAG: DNA polymerase III subunit delta' [Deltaproteobacteria bacterium GWC2_56_8]|nr:MAG: DNA polymerase III subunit delta' [Deltaproteobacteria bacterium GWB2_55_19]OGP37849.1 MAG: DNA polymerase III subunit delta' [Deltaproteobacteria bacterium GWC2_56_8]HAO93271.1 DNA polymerase III subunit delta' [Deltaproteobacteria bacterium]